MNFKLKALTVAAITAMSLSGAANAIPQTDMFLLAYDSVSQKSFVADLGATAAFSNTTAITPFDYSADANWASFIAGSTASNIQYQVLGTNAANTIWTTSNDLSLLSNAGQNTRMNNAIGGLNPGGALNFFLAANTGVTNFVPSSAAFGKGSEIGIDWSTAFNNFTTTANLGQNDNFYQIVKNGTKGTNILITNTFLQTDGVTNSFWNLSTGGVLSYTSTSVAAVPEADTSAMMLAGLGLMGFVARRRKA
jgi:hypothetical protein